MTKYGWKPDIPDHRDHTYSAPRRRVAALPSSVNLNSKCPPVFDQGELGSCTGNAIATAFSFVKKKAGPKAPFFIPSRLFIYYNERVMEGTVPVDNGAQIRNGIKSIAKLGVCQETHWPYDIRAFRKKPTPPCYKEGLLNQAVSYQRVARSLTQMKGCLADGFPFVFGFAVYENFEGDKVARTGKLDMPSKSEASLGGHAVICIGYSDATERFLVRNSWGDDWGKGGNFTMPYEYVLDANLSDDFWTIRTVE